MSLEARLVGKLEEGKSFEPELMGKVFSMTAGGVLNEALMRFRAACFSPELIARKVQALCDPPSGAVEALDVGTNIGAKTKLLLEILAELDSQPTMTGIDLSERAIEIAKARYSFPNVRYEVADFVHMSHEPDRYDYITLAAVLHHIKDPKEALDAITTCLKPGGVALILNGFYPENSGLRVVALLLQRLYRIVEQRDGLAYTAPRLSEFKDVVTEHGGLQYCGDFSTGFPSSLFNTYGVVLQKPLQSSRGFTMVGSPHEARADAF